MDKEDLRRAMQEAQDMQLDLVQAQSDLAHTEVLGQSHNAKVKVSMTAEGNFQSVKVDPTLLAEGLAAVETNMLEALKDASKKATELTKSKLAEISKTIDL